MLLEEFDYYLPEDRIAQRPLERRDMSRLMVLNREDNSIENKHFTDMVEYINPEDVLVINDTRVIPARLEATRISGASVEILLMTRLNDDRWECLVKPGRKCKTGEKLVIDENLFGIVEEKTESGGRIIKFITNLADKTVDEQLEASGEMPLPHYIRERLSDPERYQTVYSKEKGSIAAPTAGLHFTDEVFESLKRKGVRVAKVTLHVGLGTFRPVKTDVIEEHVMHSEQYELSSECVNEINEAKQRGGRVFAVGTTTVRTLESVFAKYGELKADIGKTDIFIYPGYDFKVIDCMLTNFHLPKSTLIMLVSAFAGREYVLEAYKKAVDEGYRFFSLGDSMLIL